MATPIPPTLRDLSAPPPARAAIVVAALEVEGLGADTPEAYLDLIGPDESEETRHQMLGKSSCALAIRGFFRRLGVKHKRLEAPYVDRMAVDDVLEIAKEAGAYHPVYLGEPWEPAPGMILHVYAPEHVLTLVKVTPDGTGWLCESIDGGQGKDGAYIRRVYRRIIGSRDTRLDTGVSRAITCWIDPDAICAAFC